MSEEEVEKAARALEAELAALKEQKKKLEEDQKTNEKQQSGEQGEKHTVSIPRKTIDAVEALQRSKKREAASDVAAKSSEKKARTGWTKEEVAVGKHLGVGTGREVVLAALVKARAERPWIQWVEDFRSFLPGVTMVQRNLTKKLKLFWEEHGEAVWERYWWLGTGDEKGCDNEGRSLAIAAKLRAEKMKRAWMVFAEEMLKKEGKEVFCFLAENLHPYWPEARFGPIQWMKIMSKTSNTNEDLLAFIEKNKKRRWPQFIELAGGLSEGEYQKLRSPAGTKWGLVSLANVVGDSGKLVTAAAEVMEPLYRHVKEEIRKARVEPYPYVMYHATEKMEKSAWLAAQSATDVKHQGSLISAETHERAELHGTAYLLWGTCLNRRRRSRKRKDCERDVRNLS